MRVAVTVALATAYATAFAAAFNCSSPAADASNTPPLDSMPADTTTPPRAPVVAECATPEAGWIWCDDFESNRLSSYFEYDAADGRFVRAATAGVSGSFGMRVRYNTSDAAAGSLKLAFGKTPDAYFRPVDAGTAVYRDVFWRWYIMHPAGWSGGGAKKMTRALGLVSASWAETVLAHVWTGGPTNLALVLDPASGTDVTGVVRATTYNDFDNFRWLGAAVGATNIHDTAHLARWICIEARARLNDAGQSNGEFHLWVDGMPDAQRTGLNWVGAYTTYGINAVFFENYWDNRSPVEQARYWDNIVVSTQRIGC